MLHVRVASPASHTGQLVETLSALPGVQNLVVLASAARRPEGDAVVFDVRDGAANPVFATLRELDLDREGAIAVHRVDATLDSGAGPAKRSWSEARGSLFQLLLNVVLLIGVGAAGLRAQRAIWRRAPRSGGAT